MVYHLVLILHVLGAVIWLGGHMILAICYLPDSLKKKDSSIIIAFERKYEPLGIPVLIIQVMTGFWMALFHYKVKLFSFTEGYSPLISLKLILLLLILALAVHARFFIIPKLNNTNLKLMALHIYGVSLLSLLLLLLGVQFRF